MIFAKVFCDIRECGWRPGGHTTTDCWKKPSRPVVTIYTTSLVGRFHPFIGHEGPQGEQRYSCTLFLTTALEGGEGSVSGPGRNLPPGKTQYTLYRRLGGPQDRSEQVRKISPHQDSISGPSSPQAVAIPTELSGPHNQFNINNSTFCPHSVFMCQVWF